MDLENLPAGPNIAVLQQGIDVIRRLDDRCFQGEVGMQFRHGLDFYLCLLAGLDTGEVDYECRRRDDRIAVDRTYAVEQLEEVILGLSVLSDGTAAMAIRTRGEAPAGEIHESAPWADSSVLRELQFLFSHTVHHYAIIRLLLAAQGVEAGREFGVAPSTLRYWEKQTGHPAA